MKIARIYFANAQETEICVVGPEGQTTRLPWPVPDGRARLIERWMTMEHGAIEPYVAPPPPLPELLYAHSEWPTLPMRLAPEAVSAYGLLATQALLSEPTAILQVPDATGARHNLTAAEARRLLAGYAQAVAMTELARRAPVAS